MPHSTGIALILLVPISYALVAFTNIVSEVAVRGQDVDQLATLSSRTIAWAAVFSTPIDTWHKWIGAGLAVKMVEVDQRWLDVQVLERGYHFPFERDRPVRNALALAPPTLTPTR